VPVSPAGSVGASGDKWFEEMLPNFGRRAGTFVVNRVGKVLPLAPRSEGYH
jgi:hypothetical protein